MKKTIPAAAGVVGKRKTALSFSSFP